MKNWTQTSRGLAAGLGSGTSFALASLLAKYVYAQGVGPWFYTAIGSLLALPVLLPWWRGGSWRPLLPAGIAGAVSMLLFNVALARLDLMVATLFAYTFPAFALLLAWVARGRVPTRWQAAASALCLLGVGLVTGDPAGWYGTADLTGILCALGAAVAHAAYALFGERMNNGDGARAVALTSVLTVVFALALAPVEMTTGLPAPWPLWLLFALSALIARILPLWLLTIGSRLAGAGPVSLAATIELPLGLLAGFVVLGERLLPLQWAGAALVITAIAMSRMGPGR